jgi:hypothetical protein
MIRGCQPPPPRARPIRSRHLRCQVPVQRDDDVTAVRAGAQASSGHDDAFVLRQQGRVRARRLSRLLVWMLCPFRRKSRPAGTPGSAPSRPASRARRSSAPRWQPGACYCGSLRRASRLIRSITVVPPAPAGIPTSSQTRRASARPLPPPCPPSEAAPAAGCQRPLSRTSACAARRRPAAAAAPPATRTGPDRVRRDLADRDHEIIRPGRRQARPRRPPRRKPAHLPQVISAESQPARHGKTPPPPHNVP